MGAASPRGAHARGPQRAPVRRGRHVRALTVLNGRPVSRLAACDGTRKNPDMPALERTFACLLLLAAVPVPAADVYKCIGADGTLIYSDRPCPAGARTEAVPQRAHAAAPAGGPSDTERVCAAVAAPLWDLQPLETGGQLDLEQSTLVRTTRERLRGECGMRLAVSALAHECRQRTLEVTAAVQRAADPRHARELERVQAEYEARCSDAARDADIIRHLRPLEPGAP